MRGGYEPLFYRYAPFLSGLCVHKNGGFPLSDNRRFIFEI
jgi:hypothetical protein